MRKWIKLLAICLSVGCVVWLIYIYFKSSAEKRAPITPVVSSSLTQTYGGSPTITLSVNKTDFNHVDRLPFLEISQKTLTDGYARGVGSNLGFQGEPTVVNDTLEGETYFWKNENTSLFIYLKSSKIHYNLESSLNVINKQLSDLAILATVKNFLTSNKILTDGSFAANKVIYLTTDPVNESFKETSRENASLYQVNIYPSSTQYEILATSSTENANYVQMTKDGNIYSLQLTIFDSVQNGPTDYQLKNYDQIQASLSHAVLISLGGEETPLSQLPTDTIQRVNIDKIETAYLMDSPTSTTLQPVYKLSGTTTLSGSGTEVSAIFYLPALVSD